MRKAILGTEVIDLDKLTKSELIPLRRRRDFFCIHCKKAVIFKNGTRKRAHFSHEKDSLSTSNPESAAHLLVKHSFAKWLKEQKIIVEIEKRFPQIDRIADVYFEYQNAKYVIEIQKSPMSDAEFNQRITDYKQVNVTVLWIFLGNMVEKGHQFRLPAVMLGRGESSLFHFCVKRAELKIFENPVFLTTRDIYALPIRGKLNEFSVENLLLVHNECDRNEYLHQKNIYFDQDWLEVKKKFRKRGWFYASKSEKKLLEQCLIRGFNLSLLPTEIGWPIAGAGMRKHLFIWQAYVLLTVMKYFNLDVLFTLKDLMKHLEIEYKVLIDEHASKQVSSYLKWLIMFGIVEKTEKGLYRCIKAPEAMSTLELSIAKDKKFIEVIRNLLKV